MERMKDKYQVSSEKSYVVSPDHKATETEGPYPPYAVLQEFGWTGNSGNRYMRPALKRAQERSAGIIANVSSQVSVVDDSPPDILMKAFAEVIKEKAQDFAPKDTTELAYGTGHTGGRGIFVEEIEK